MEAGTPPGSGSGAPVGGGISGVGEAVGMMVAATVGMVGAASLGANPVGATWVGAGDVSLAGTGSPRSARLPQEDRIKGMKKATWR
jgi:hypothetical protein